MSKSHWLLAIGLIAAPAAGYPTLAQTNGMSEPNARSDDRGNDHRMMGMMGMMNMMGDGMTGGCMRMMQSMHGGTSGRPNEQWRHPEVPSGRG
jgi:hypothetical protein